MELKKIEGRQNEAQIIPTQGPQPIRNGQWSCRRVANAVMLRLGIPAGQRTLLQPPTIKLQPCSNAGAITAGVRNTIP